MTQDEIKEGLTRVETEVRNVGTTLGELKSWMTRMNETIYGNGQAGLTTRMDRQEQRANRNAFLIGAVLIPLIPMTAGGIWALIQLVGK